MTNNPFFVGGPVPPEYFIGRSSEIDIAFDTIAKRSHAAFYGSSGMGKSSLLNFLASPQAWQKRRQDQSHAFIIYLNCSNINPFSPSGFWREILNLFKDELSDENDLKAIIDQVLEEEEFDRSEIRQILRNINKKEKFLLLLIDEYDVALRIHDNYTEVEMVTFLSEFRNLAVDNKFGKSLSTIITTSRRLNELGPKVSYGGSPWYNHYLFQPIRPYSKPEVIKEFFTSNSPRYIRVKQSLQEAVLSITDGHPELLQNAGHLLHSTLQQGQIPDSKTFIRDFQGRTEQVFDNIWRSSQDVEQILLMLIALSNLQGRLGDKNYAISDIDRIFSQRARELIDLEEKGIIKHIERDGKYVYVFTSTMIEWWVLKEIENSNEDELEKREKIFLKIMSRGQTEQVSNVIKLVWKNREGVKSLVKMISKFFGDPT